MARSFTTRRHAAITAVVCLLARGTAATNHAGEGAAPAASPPFPVLPVAQSSAQVMSSPPALSYPGATGNQSYLALGMEMPILATAGAGSGSSDSAELIFVSPESYLLFVQQGMMLDGSTQLNMSGGLLSSSADPFVSFEEPTGLFSSLSAANSDSSTLTGSSSSDMRLLAVLLYSPPTPQPGAAALNWTTWAADMSANPSLRINFDVQDFASRSGLGEPVAAEVLVVEDQLTASSDNPDDNSQSLVPVSTVIPAAGQAEPSNTDSASTVASATGPGGQAGAVAAATGALLSGGMQTGGAGGTENGDGSGAGSGKEGNAAEGSQGQGTNAAGEGQDGSCAATGASNGEDNDKTKGSQVEGSRGQGAGSGGQGDAEEGAGGAGAAGSNKDVGEGSSGGANGESTDDESGCDPEEEQGAGNAGEPGSSGGNSTMASATGGEVDPAAPKITAAAGTGDQDGDNDFVIGFDMDGKFGTTITADLPFRAARRTAGPQQDDWIMTLNTDARLALGGLMQATAASASSPVHATDLSTMTTTTTTPPPAQDALATATAPASSATPASTSLSSTTFWPSSTFRVVGLASVALAVLTYV